jgi:hypothetical protein
MAVRAISVADAAVGSRIVFTGPDSSLEGAFTVRETSPVGSGKVAVVLQPVDGGGAAVEATVPGDTTVGLALE